MSNKPNDPLVGPDQPIRFSMGTVVTILVAAFVLGGTFTSYAVEFKSLQEKVDRLTTVLEKHVGVTIASTTGCTVEP